MATGVVIRIYIFGDLKICRVILLMLSYCKDYHLRKFREYYLDRFWAPGFLKLTAAY
jgi:hypothetical protein